MKTLIGIEIRRMTARRLMRVLFILAIAAIAFFATIAFFSSNDSPAAIAQTDAERNVAMTQCIEAAEMRVAAGDPHALDGESGPEALCERDVWVSDPRFRYEEMHWVLMSLGVPIMMLGWLLGASSIGAEWHHRSIATLLTWEPRRVRVLASKVIAAVIVVFLGAVALQLVVAGAFYPAAAFRGTLAGVDRDWLVTAAGTIARVGGLAALGAVMGLSIAALGRNTAAAFGAGFVYLAVIEGLIRGFRPSWRDWLVGDNVGLVLVGRQEAQLGHSELGGALLLVGYGIILALIATAVFKLRDVN